MLKKAFKAQQIIDCSWRRWAIKTSYPKLTQTMLGKDHTCA
jgi:hypothetical protein